MKARIALIFVFILPFLILPSASPHHRHLTVRRNPQAPMLLRFLRQPEVVPHPTIPSVPLGPTISPATFVAWDRVANCETGGNWAMEGPVYSGALGISNHNWWAYGGGEFASNAGLASPSEQIIVAERIQSSPPDQWGCSAAGW